MTASSANSSLRLCPPVLRIALALMAAYLTACEGPAERPHQVVESQIVTIDGRKYQEFQYHGRLIRTPVAESADLSGSFPSWYLKLPIPARATDLDQGGARITVRLISRPESYTQSDIEQRLTSGDLSGPGPVKLYNEWGLALYADWHPRSGTNGYGLWVPINESIRSPDGKRPVLNCIPVYPDADFPDVLRCELEGRLSPEVRMQAIFRGSELASWQIVHDVAWNLVQERVTPITYE